MYGFFYSLPIFFMFAFHSEYFFDLITTTEKVPLAAFSRYKKFISSPLLESAAYIFGLSEIPY